ncbi:hypothetical protein GMB86_08765 [Terrilactibacillus sp. BCM23-1]|uniref:Uncharacterized protein n=1 Tax=Terrilactibacillus tamarindi TaxID=2599694 RepID=A0A6N8CSB9_9BACI|nr:hypothetical protein [Terrilactibacillus tamarindi]MTT32097.1 hypothetical protein [Terrilactibacillus tamarindi]
MTVVLKVHVQKGDKLEARRLRQRRFEDRNVGFYYMRTGITSQRRDSQLIIW